MFGALVVLIGAYTAYMIGATLLAGLQWIIYVARGSKDDLN